MNNPKTLVFSTSNSSNSINRKIINYAASLVKDSETIDLRDFDVPIYSIDLEGRNGIPNRIKELNQKISEFDILIIGLNEHNGYLSAFFKNILDWLSRENPEFLKDKSVVLIGSSPGVGGGQSSLKAMQTTLPVFGANIVASLSVGSFDQVFQQGKLINETINSELKDALSKLN